MSTSWLKVGKKILHEEDQELIDDIIQLQHT